MKLKESTQKAEGAERRQFSSHLLIKYRQAILTSLQYAPSHEYLAHPHIG